MLLSLEGEGNTEGQFVYLVERLKKKKRPWLLFLWSSLLSRAGGRLGAGSVVTPCSAGCCFHAPSLQNLGSTLAYIQPNVH